MGNPAMALPAEAYLVDVGNGAFVAADAVALHHFLTVAADVDPLGHPAGVKGQGIFHAVDAFPDIVNRLVLVRQMAVNTHLAPMGAGMGPGIILRLHDMAARAEGWSFRFRQEPGRPQHHENRSNNAYPEDGQTERHDPLPLPVPH